MDQLNAFIEQHSVGLIVVAAALVALLMVHFLLRRQSKPESQSNGISSRGTGEMDEKGNIKLTVLHSYDTVEGMRPLTHVPQGKPKENVWQRR